MERARRDPRRVARTAPGPGRHVGPGRHELRRVGARRDGRLGVPVRRRRHRDAVPADRAHPRRLERPAARRPRGPALRLPRRRAVGPAPRPPLQPEQAAARPVRPGHHGRADPGAGPARPRRRTLHPQRRRLRAVHAAQRRRARRLRLGRRPADAAAVARHGDLRAARQGLHPAPQRDPRAPARHVRRPRHADGDQLPPGPRRDGGRADAGAPVLHRAGRRGARDEELLGLQLHRLLRPARRLQLVGRPRAAGDRVQADGQELPRGRHRGLPRRGLQPHGRGRGVRADVRLPGPGRPRLLQALRRPGQRLLGRHRVRQHRGLLQRGRAAADPRLAALLGHRDARRRLPLRPRVGAGAHAVTTSTCAAPSSPPSGRTRCCGTSS